ncbi:EAL domain-containing protein [Enterobacter roggenkampii]|uniref:EAL domain-containing protein n=1 Tax=Enterobacter roggenkampii TaxID=1812935 RepID=UPI000DA175E3|nr:EAL domain-containing protein [Enterobacter roggenkampii]
MSPAPSISCGIYPLAAAIRQQDIIPWYQPLICSSTGKICGIEVLARWKTTAEKYIPPDYFIPQAEKSGLIVPLTQQLMARTAVDLSPVIENFCHPFKIALNISLAHIRTRKIMIEDVMTFLNLFSAGSIQVILELNEREQFQQTPRFHELLLELQRMGVMIALDDFGTGYSNLCYLNMFPVDYIKIDRSFISCIPRKSASNIIQFIINTAKHLDVGVIVEGVENQKQADWLKGKNIEIMQGYYFYKALSITELKDIAVQKRF